MYSEKVQKTNDDMSKSIDKIEKQAQTNLNKRLDKMRFKNYTASEFASTAPHADTDISFVTNQDSTISLYKGDTLLSGQGTEDETNIAYAVFSRIGGGVDGRYDPVGLGFVPGQGATRYREPFSDDPIFVYGGYENWHAFHGLNSDNYKQGVVFSFGLKHILDSRFDTMTEGQTVSGMEYSQPVRMTYNYPFMRSDGNGGFTTEILSITREIEGVNGLYSQTGGWNGSAYVGTRSLRSYELVYRLKIQVTNTVSGTTTTAYIHDLPGYWSDRTALGNRTPTPSGFVLGFTDVEDIGLTGSSYANMPQLKSPHILWFSSSTDIQTTVGASTITTRVYMNPTLIKDTLSNPLGIKYDVSTGQALSEPLFCFSSRNEQEVGYIMSLQRDIRMSNM